MLNPHEIAATHLASMQAAVLKNRSRLDEHTVAKLYKSARTLLYDPSDLAKTDMTLMKSRFEIAGPGLIVSTCTDVNTGLFVQLIGPSTAKDDQLNLIFGIKFCQEMTDPVRSQRATKIW